MWEGERCCVIPARTRELRRSRASHNTNSLPPSPQAMAHNLANNFLTVNLVRHAQSMNNTIAANLRKTVVTHEEFWTQYEAVRSHDPALSDKGVAQANALASHLKNIKISKPLRLFCSALHRSINTAQCLAGTLGVTPELWVDIFEEGGLYLSTDPSVRSGKTLSEIEALGVKTPTEFRTGVVANATEQGWWNHEKETPEECIARATAVVKKLQELANFYAGQRMTLWLVSHDPNIRHKDLYLPLFPRSAKLLDHKRYFYHDNCGVTQFCINGVGEVKVAFINRHIAPFGEVTLTDSPAHVAPSQSNVPL